MPASSILPTPIKQLAANAGWLTIAVGLLVLYAPSLYDLFNGLWSTTENMHGPVVMGISCWLIYRNWAAMQSATDTGKPSFWGWLVFGLSLLVFAFGRAMNVQSFEVGSVIGLLIGIVLVRNGKAALKVQWFALFFMLFMVPLPATIIDVVTQPMKMAVSYVAENILYTAGYPISRNGVILQIGQYLLLVADACAGLHTLLTLEALGLLYLNLVRRNSPVRNIVLALLIVPISFTANVIRVMSLTLITYHFGDAAGQGFLHGFAGMVLFMSALMLIISFDTLLQAAEGRFSPSQSPKGVA